MLQKRSYSSAYSQRKDTPASLLVAGYLFFWLEGEQPNAPKMSKTKSSVFCCDRHFDAWFCE